MDIVLGVSMTPAAVQMVLVEGDNADGLTVDQDAFPIDPPGSESDQVASAILGTRESAREGGHRLTSTGVAVADQSHASLLRAALADRKIDNVTLVSGFLAAVALAQTVGGAIGYERTALLFVDTASATLAVVDSADGSVSEVRREDLPADGAAATATLAAMVAGSGALASRPDGVFVVGAGVDVGAIKPQLEAASPLPVSAPEEPETALARGAALASAHAPLLDSSTSALAWARDPGTGMIDPELLALGFAQATGDSADYERTVGEQALAYSAVVDNESDSGYLTVPDAEPLGGDHLAPSVEEPTQRKPFLLVGSTLAAIFVIGVSALVVALAVSIRPTAAHRPAPDQHIVVPAQQLQAPPKVQPPAPAPAAPPAPPPEAVPAPAPVPAAPPVPAPEAPAPIPAAPAPPAPVPAAPVPIPIPIPAAPVIPAPEAPAPIAPPAAPQQPVPEQPPVFSPPKQSPPQNGGGWPGNGGKDGGNQWLPGNGDRDSLNPWLPGNSGGQSGPNPWLPGNSGGNHGGNSWLPGNSGRGGGDSWWPGTGGGNSWLPGSGQRGGGERGGGGIPGWPSFGGGGGHGGGQGGHGGFGGGHGGFGFGGGHGGFRFGF